MINPYSDIGPVNTIEELFGRDYELRTLIGRILQGQNVVVYGERRIGKTSLLNVLTQAVSTQNIARTSFKQDISDYLFVMVSGRTLLSNNLTTVWKAISRNIHLAFEEKHGIKGTSINPEIQENYLRIQEAKKLDSLTLDVDIYLSSLRVPIILIFDDFDIFLNSLASSELDMFTAKLRALLSVDHNPSTHDEVQRITLCAACSDSLLTLLETNSIDLRSSSWLANVLQSIELGLLSQEGVQNIMLRAGQAVIAENDTIPLKIEDVDFAFKLVGGQPFLVKVTASFIWDHYIQYDNELDFEKVEAGVVNDVRVSWLLQTLWQRANKSPSHTVMTGQQALIDLISNRSNSRLDPQITGFLESLGLIYRNKGKPQIFCKIFENYIRSQIESVSTINKDTHYSQLQVQMSDDTRLAKIAGVQVKLTKREYMVLKLLTENIGNVVETDKIVKEVWKGKELSKPLDSVAQTIKSLRQRLAAFDPNRDFIETEYGKGYKLVNIQVVED